MNSTGLAPTQRNTTSVKVLRLLSGSDQWVIWSMSSLLLAASFALSVYFKNSNFLSASGGVVTIIGLLILASISIPVNERDIEIEYRKYIGHDFPANDTYWRNHYAESHNRFIKDKNGHLFGINVSIVGTVVWAYGWLIDYLPFMAVNKCI